MTVHLYQANGVRCLPRGLSGFNSNLLRMMIQVKGPPSPEFRGTFSNGTRSLEKINTRFLVGQQTAGHVRLRKYPAQQRFSLVSKLEAAKHSTGQRPKYPPSGKKSLNNSGAGPWAIVRQRLTYPPPTPRALSL
jgi:hypothetical protein